MFLITFYEENLKSSRSEKQGDSEIRINYSGAGFSMNIPGEWVYQSTPNAIILGHNTIPGMVLISPVVSGSMQSLFNEIHESLQQGGSDLVLQANNPDAADEHTLKMSLSGHSGFQQISGYSVNRLSPHGGGISVSTVVASQFYDRSYIDLVEKIASSVSFFEPHETEITRRWKNRLSGKRVSNSSGSYGQHGGWHERNEFHLCSNGAIHGSSRSGVSVQAGSAHGSSQGGSGFMQGRWRIRSFGDFPAIEVIFSNGSVYRAVLAEQNGRVYLNNQPWFVTNDAQCG